MKTKKIIFDGLLNNNPIFVMTLGMCPTLAMSNNLTSAFWIGFCTMIVLVVSNLVISLIGRFIPGSVRLPCYIVIISTIGTLVDMIVAKYLPDLYGDIGKFIQLIVVNCIVLARAEAFAASNKPHYALLDGISMGGGFLLGICLLGVIREFLSTGSLWGVKLVDFSGIGVFGLAAGGFLTLGILMGLFNYIYSLTKRKKNLRDIAVNCSCLSDSEEK